MSSPNPRHHQTSGHNVINATMQNSEFSEQTQHSISTNISEITTNNLLVTQPDDVMRSAPRDVTVSFDVSKSSSYGAIQSARPINVTKTASNATKPSSSDVIRPSTHDVTADSDSDVESSGPQSERTSLLDVKDTASYSRRWYVLGVFSLAAAVQGGGWATWGPITQTAKAVLGWSDASIALQPLWGNLAFILVMVPVTWMMDVKGLRISMIFALFFLAAGFSLRCVTMEPPTATWLINVGQMLIGVGGSVPFSGVSLIAATWFRPNERATATAIASVFSYVGVAVSFIVGPQLVPEPPNATKSNAVNWSVSLDGDVNFSNLTDSMDLTKHREAIQRLLYYEAGLAGFLLLLVLVYFPAKPPRPPSRTASLPRTEFGKGVRALLANRRYWILAVSYCIPVGTYGAFSGIMDIDLHPTGISQQTAGWLGFYATVGGCVAGLFASRLADLFMRRLKLILLVLFVGAAGAMAWFCLLVVNYIHFDLASLYASSILTGVFVNGALPLFYEAACEVTYPVAEGVTTGIMTVLNNVVGVVFFALLFIPGIGVEWMNWVLLGTVVAAVPLLLLLKEHYARIDIDTANMQIDVADPSA